MRADREVRVETGVEEAEGVGEEVEVEATENIENLENLESHESNECTLQMGHGTREDLAGKCMTARRSGTMSRRTGFF